MKYRWPIVGRKEIEPAYDDDLPFYGCAEMHPPQFGELTATEYQARIATEYKHDSANVVRVPKGHKRADVKPLAIIREFRESKRRKPKTMLPNVLTTREPIVRLEGVETRAVRKTKFRNKLVLRCRHCHCPDITADRCNNCGGNRIFACYE